MNTTTDTNARNLSARGWIYTFRADDGNGYVVHNRAGEIVHRSKTFAEGSAWVDANLEVIDEPLDRPEFLNKFRNK